MISRIRDCLKTFKLEFRINYYDLIKYHDSMAHQFNMSDNFKNHDDLRHEILKNRFPTIRYQVMDHQALFYSFRFQQHKICPNDMYLHSPLSPIQLD